MSSLWSAFGVANAARAKFTQAGAARFPWKKGFFKSSEAHFFLLGFQFKPLSYDSFGSFLRGRTDLLSSSVSNAHGDTKDGNLAKDFDRLIDHRMSLGWYQTNYGSVWWPSGIFATRRQRDNVRRQWDYTKCPSMNSLGLPLAMGHSRTRYSTISTNMSWCWMLQKQYP